MGKIQTLQELKRTLTFSLILMLLVLGSVFIYMGIELINPILYSIGGLCYSIVLITLPMMFLFWCIKNNIGHGLKYAIKHYLLVNSLNKQLVDANIFTEVKIGSLLVAKVPWIRIDFNDDFKTGTVFIKDSVKFHEKLKNLNISSALHQFVVEQMYLTNDGNYYYFEFYDTSIERRIKFSSLEEFKQYANYQGQYDIFIDSFSSVPVMHTLLVGATRSGKSYALMCCLLQFLVKHTKYHLYFVDMKHSSTGLLGDVISPDNTAKEYDDIVRLLEKFVDSMNQRKILMERNLANKIDGDYTSFNLSPHILIFDEYASFASILQTKEKKHRDYVNSKISQIILMGAGLGYFIYMIAQKSGSEIIPTHIRDNLLLKIVLGNAEDTTYQTAFGTGVEIPEGKFGKGEGVYTYSGIANKPKLCSFSTLNFDIHKAFQEAKGL